MYVPGPTVYVERTYERPREQIIQYVPIEEAPVVERTDSNVRVVETSSFLQEGDALFREGRYEEARRQYVRALLADENDPAVQLSYGFAHFALGEYRVAARAVRRALTADPGLMDAPPDPRAAYGDAADFEKQLAALRACVVETPQDMEAAFLLGYIAYAMVNTELALEELNRVLAADDADTLAYVLRDTIVCAESAPAEQAKRRRSGVKPPP